MRCLYCDRQIEKLDLKNIFIEEDRLCIDCRSKLKVNRKYVDLKKIKVETLYDYDQGIFKDLLIQYKECFDEALCEVFLYIVKDYLKFRYHGYQILYVPSSKQKQELRGFDHLQLIFKNSGLKQAKGLKIKEDLVQEGKNLAQRRAMLDNYIYEGDRLNKVLIVDDVITSGSSISGVYNAIFDKAEKVKALALARKENAFICGNKCAKIKKRRII